MVLRALHLCSGYGGFELALRGIARTVGYVERDAYAAATLVARMEDRARNSPHLPAAVAMWPTPRASMNENRTTKNAPSHGVTHGRTLAGTASHHGQTTGTGGTGGMVLNPRFVEALMGLPAGWLTPCTSGEMDSSRKPLGQLGTCLPVDCVEVSSEAT